MLASNVRSNSVSNRRTAFGRPTVVSAFIRVYFCMAEKVLLGNEEYAKVCKFWDANGTVFTKWFCSLSYLDQRKVLHEACPDLPENIKVASASVKLLPELNYEHLLNNQGYELIRLFYQRVQKIQVWYAQDLEYLKSLHDQKLMPTFTDVPKDEENVLFHVIDVDGDVDVVCKVLRDVSLEELKRVERRFEMNKIVEVDVWVSLKFKLNALFAFLSSVGNKFEFSFMQVGKQQVAKVGCRWCGLCEHLSSCTCGMAHYCNKEHQKLDWKSHKTCHKSST